MKRHGFALWEIVAVLAVIVIAANFLYPIFFRAKEDCCPPTCQSNLKKIALGFRMYMQDSDEKYLPSAINDNVDINSFYGWGDALQPYVKNTQIYQCMDEPHSPTQPADPTQPGYTDYWYNQNLAGREERELESVSQTILAGDGNDGSDDTTARYNISKFPGSWRTDKKSPIHRHKGGLNYAFADGHVRWYKPEEISVAAIKDAEGKPTFAWK